jgi:hypothetical protein
VEEYDSLIRHPAGATDRASVERFQREECEAAAMLMRTAAEDYIKQQEIGRARPVYRQFFTPSMAESTVTHSRL